MLNASEVPVTMDDDPKIKNLDLDDVLNDIKKILKHNNHYSDEVLQYIDKIEEQIEEEKLYELSCVDQEEVKELILKHPYFKNPSSYHIRLITIMKYLKKKGVDITISDFDLLVDDIIMSIEGVEKIGYGKYRRKKF